MRFLATIDHNQIDPLPPLGEKVEPPAETRNTTPARTGTPGVFKGEDGKLFTSIPENEVASAGMPTSKPKAIWPRNEASRKLEEKWKNVYAQCVFNTRQAVPGTDRFLTSGNPFPIGRVDSSFLGRPLNATRP